MKGMITGVLMVIGIILLIVGMDPESTVLITGFGGFMVGLSCSILAAY